MIYLFGRNDKICVILERTEPQKREREGRCPFREKKFREVLSENERTQKSRVELCVKDTLQKGLVSYRVTGFSGVGGWDELKKKS